MDSQQAHAALIQEGVERAVAAVAAGQSDVLSAMRNAGSTTNLALNAGGNGVWVLNDGTWTNITPNPLDLDPSTDPSSDPEIVSPYIFVQFWLAGEVPGIFPIRNDF